MKLLFLALALGFSASAFSAPYDGSWFQTQFWSGEYPNGFSVNKSGVTVMGRSGMDKDLPAEMACALPFKATFHIWNTERNDANQVEYHTASKIVPLIAREDFLFEDGEKKVQIHKGDLIEYLIYHSEGWFAVRIDGQEYEADQSLFDNVEEVSQDQFVQDEWMHLTCENGTSTWLYYPDLFNADGEFVSGLQGPKIEGYGTATDLTDKNLQP